ncbi:ABC transporter substrate-binding protein [Sphingobacteriales bacterium UPWRP_1]|nr:hypothetical protein BVG80_18260 [Sphingobacteriales bacterium TSM_CSM]PSJ73587.1 ABC transporter substrate-binding protein [Sphingobacteriales bacterium UPWRP_1]
MANKIKISSVSYLNTKPFIYGLEKTGLLSEIDLQLEMPSKTAEKLLNGEAQIGLVPVAIIPQLPNARILTNYCIGAVGAVKTVSLFGQQPLEQMRTILLDYQSCTSVQLVQILCAHYWKQPHIHFAPAYKHYEQAIEGATGGVIIGDRTIDLAPRFAYNYDLSEAWHRFTNLPFVFAAWVTTQPIDPELEERLNHAFETGLQLLDEVVQLYQPQYGNRFNVQEYFTRYISYRLDTPKRNGLELFLSYVKQNTEVAVV